MCTFGDAFNATNVESYIHRNGSSFFILSVRPSAAVVSQGEILRPNIDLVHEKCGGDMCFLFSLSKNATLCT